MNIPHLNYFIWSLFLGTFLMAFGFEKAQGQIPQYVEGDVIIKFKDSSDIATRQSLNDGSETLVLEGVSESVTLQLKQSFNNFSIQHYSSVNEEKSTGEIIQQIQNHPLVEYVEPNYLLRKADIPKTDIFTLAEAKEFNTTQRQRRDPIHAGDARNLLSNGKSPARMAVLDTGIDVNHKALANVIWTNTGEIPGNGLDDDQNGFRDDIHGWNFADNDGDLTDCDGHGTHVAGIVAQTVQDIFSENDSTNTSPSSIEIIGLKFLGCDGVGSTSNAIKAIDYAIDNGAKVLNNSWGNNVYSYALHEAINRSYLARTLFVAAAGNNQSNNDIEPFYPASYPVPNVISVAATDLNDNFAVNISNFGSLSVHEAAPGVRILSTYPDNQYALLSGTSMAAPFVSGVATLMIYEQPGLTGYQVKNLIQNSSEQLAGLDSYVEGQRRLHASNAILQARQATPDNNLPSYQMPPPSSSASFASKLGFGGGCGMVSKMYSDMNQAQSSRKGGKGGKGGRGGHLPKALFGFMLALPLVLWTYFRQQALKPVKRKHQRYAVDMSAQLFVAGHLAPAHVFSISQGGAGLSIGKATDLHKGDQIDVQLSAQNKTFALSGRVVWLSKSQGKAGVQFKQEASWIQDVFSRYNLDMVKENS